MRRAHVLRCHGVYTGSYSREEMVHIHMEPIYFLVLYGLYLTHIIEVIKQRWTEMKKYVLRMALETYLRHKHGRLMKIAGLLLLQEHLGCVMDSLPRRVGNRVGKDKNKARTNQEILVR